jgi:hypothetical protein
VFAVFRETLSGHSCYLLTFAHVETSVLVAQDLSFCKSMARPCTPVIPPGKKDGGDTSSLVNLGRWFIQRSREQAKSVKAIYTGASLSGVMARQAYIEHCTRMSYIFRYYSLSEFESAIEQVEDWEYFIQFYGEDGVATFSSGRRYLLEQDMGL